MNKLPEFKLPTEREMSDLLRSLNCRIASSGILLLYSLNKENEIPFDVFTTDTITVVVDVDPIDIKIIIKHDDVELTFDYSKLKNIDKDNNFSILEVIVSYTQYLRTLNLPTINDEYLPLLGTIELTFWLSHRIVEWAHTPLNDPYFKSLWVTDIQIKSKFSETPKMPYPSPTTF